MAKLPVEASILCMYPLHYVCELKCSPMRASVVALLPATNSPDHGSVPGAASWVPRYGDNTQHISPHIQMQICPQASTQLCHS